MKQSEQLSRHALYWLILCHFTVFAPHLLRAPLWILAVYIVCTGWRLLVFQQRLPMPGRALRFTLTILTSAAVFVSYDKPTGLEPMVALLLAATALKFTEAVRTTDGYVLVVLGFLVCVTTFLFSQSLPIAAYGVLSAWLLVTSLVALNEPSDAPLSWASGVMAGKLLLLALPLMAVVFVLFPRIGPLWQVPSAENQATTGMSDTLRPGDVSQLSRSAEVAFRARFEGQIPNQSTLYWRGMVLNDFDGEAWRMLDIRAYPESVRASSPAPADSDTTLNYRVIMPATQQPWLYLLHRARSDHRAIVARPDDVLQRREPIDATFAFGVSSDLGPARDIELSDWQREFETRLPPELNPRTRAWVATLHGKSAADIVTTTLRFLREQPFYYTLEPPVIASRNFVDTFLFDVRRGFCEHFAYSFVVAMRMAGVPARVVAGYQGGEINPLTNSVTVRQYDAHAWAEVWLQGQGWVRIDPTAAVAPERIELGIEQALSQRGERLPSQFALAGTGAVQWLRLRYDALAWQWQRFIVGFDGRQQRSVLKDWFGELNPQWFAAVLIGSCGAVLAPLTWWLNRRQRAMPSLSAERRFLRLCHRLRRDGLTRHQGESPVATLARARQILASDDPRLSALEQAVSALYEQPSNTARQSR